MGVTWQISHSTSMHYQTTYIVAKELQNGFCQANGEKSHEGRYPPWHQIPLDLEFKAAHLLMEAGHKTPQEIIDLYFGAAAS